MRLLGALLQNRVEWLPHTLRSLPGGRAHIALQLCDRTTRHAVLIVIGLYDTFAETHPLE